MDESILIRGYWGAADDVSLAGIAAQSTGETYTPARIAYELGTPGIDPARDIAICHGDDRSIHGFACLHTTDVEGVAQGQLTTRAKSGHPVVPEKLLAWAARRMQEVRAESNRSVTIIETVPNADRKRGEFLENAGFRVARYFHVMRLDDPGRVDELELPAGFRYIHGPGHEGAASYVEMFNSTWIDHYSFSPISIEDFLHDIDSDPDYDPDMDIVIENPQHQYVGFAFCRTDPSDPSLGEVMVIGIRRGSRGLGLGRTLLTHSVRILIEKGANRVELSVDSENPTGALRLYETVGFRSVSMKSRYQLDAVSIDHLASIGDS